MATIKNLTVNTDRSVTLVTDTGDILSMSSALAGVLKEQFLLRELHDGISNVIDDAISDGDLDLSKYDGSREEFEDEIYTDLADEITYGDYTALCNDGEWIKEKVYDLANFYELEPSDDDYDDEEDEEEE